MQLKQIIVRYERIKLPIEAHLAQLRVMIPSKKVTISSLVKEKCNYFRMPCIEKELTQLTTVSEKIER